LGFVFEFRNHFGEIDLNEKGISKHRNVLELLNHLTVVTHFEFQVGGNGVFVHDLFHRQFVFIVKQMFFSVVFPHFLEIAHLVLTFLLDVPNDKTHLNDNRIINNLVVERVSLDRLVVRSFGSFTENTSAVFPSPETSRGFQNVRNEFFQDGVDFRQGRIVIQIGMVILRLDLEQGRLFSIGLLNQVFISQ